MSRTFDLLLVALVVGLGWWLFARERGPEDPLSGPPAGAVNAPVASAPGPGVAPDGASLSVETPAPSAGPVAVTWAVDDAAVLAHPSFQFVVAEVGTGRLQPLAWRPTSAGGVMAELEPGQTALGLALVQPTLEVLAWIPLDPTTGAPEERPVHLGERFVRIAFDVREPEGRAVDDARLSLRVTQPARTLDGAQPGLPVDVDGKILVPRRAGLRVDVQSARGRATVEDPVDGQTVQLTQHP